MSREKDERFASKMMGVIMLILTTALLMLPSKVVPNISWLDAIKFDKIVHFFLFMFLTTAWCYYYYRGSFRTSTKKEFYLLVCIIFSIYGITIELAQAYFTVLNRSFDKFDVLADLTGTTLGYGYATKNFVRKDN
jgi:hypothetical protein